MARDCAPQVAEYQRRRKARRALRRRNGGHVAGHASVNGFRLGHGQHQQPGGNGPNNGPPGPQGSHSPSGQAQATTVFSSSSSSESVVISTTDIETTSSIEESTTDIASATTSLVDFTSDTASTTASASAPHYSIIQNFVSCPICRRLLLKLTILILLDLSDIVAFLGPYYLRDDFVRGDIREDLEGTTLYLDIGVIDIQTCQPAEDVFVEIWSCSPRGEYSAFGSGGTTNSTTGGGGGGGNSTAVPPSGSGGGGGPPSQTMSGPLPSGSGQPGGGGGGPGGGGGGGSGSKANSKNFLRGGLPVEANGLVEMTTLYPGFYTGRTVHIHTMIHQNISYHTNGTIISASGKLRHIGQIFFDEAINALVLAQEAYSGTGQSRTYNADDGILEQANTGGFSAFADIEWLGDSLEEGLLYVDVLFPSTPTRGYITIGIDSNAEYNITTNNYWDPNFTAATTIAE
ncbi:hypothetical protein FRC17_000588 [Serendipita sp. 399]|nr:hypothetical protein FRC17_000588 [Serendipita sp. 399]